MTQKQTILNHLQAHGAITSWEAIQQYGITRISEYIRVLRKEGHNIITQDVKVETKNFGPTIIGRYVYSGKAQ